MLKNTEGGSRQAASAERRTNMKKPRIGIAANILIMETGMFPGIYRAYVNNDYVESLQKAGAIPVMLPVISNLDDVADQLEGLDGVLLSGGYDVDPALYGESILPQCGYVMREVDDFYLAVVKAAVEKKLPLFGICKGVQIINIAFGGTLYQDQPSQIGSCLKHTQAAPRYQGTHEIALEKGSFLAGALGETMRVNSFHHQSVKDVAKGFKVTAKAPDGIVEGIEREEGSFVCAVQFHPEMMAKFDNPDMIRLFKAFADKCR